MVPPKQRLKYGTAEASLSLRDQNRKRLSLSQVAMDQLEYLWKYLWKKLWKPRKNESELERESLCCVKIGSPGVPLATRTRDGSMAAFSLLDQ